MAKKVIELTPVEARIVDTIYSNHSGRAHAVTSKELQAVFGIRGSTLRSYINNIRTRGIPICSCNDGYYYPIDSADCKTTVAYLSERLDAILLSVHGVELGADMLDKGLDPRDLISVTAAPKPVAIS